MSLTGALEDLSLPDVLQILSSNRLSGTLWITSRFDRGRLILRDGRLISAATNTAGERIGSLLLFHRLVSKKRLDEALEIQRVSGRRKRLGTILVEMGEVEPDQLCRVIREQFARVLGELFAWRSGHLHFQNQAAPGGSTTVDDSDILDEHGIETALLVLSALAGRAQPTPPVP